MLANLAGNNQTTQPLMAALQTGSLQHAVLLCAPDGCGRNFAARCLIADYLFPHGDDAQPGKAAVMRGESTEVLLVDGEGKSGQIPVDRIRSVRSAVFHSSLSAAGRAVHIRDAHRMAAPAANALLKVLEEPPADVLFVLTTRSPAALPATIVSRCAVYTLVPAGYGASKTLLEAALQSAPAQSSGQNLPALLSHLYGGRVGLGLRALGSESRLATVQDALAAVKYAAARKTYGLLCIFSQYEGRADGDRERRDALLSDMTDALDTSLQGQAADGLPQVPPQAAAMLLPPVSQARAALRGNAAPKSVFTALAIQLSRCGLGSPGV